LTVTGTPEAVLWMFTTSLPPPRLMVIELTYEAGKTLVYVKFDPVPGAGVP
jgi:hypothetical protein